MKTSNDKTENLATPGKPMSQKKFATMIKEAEEAEFMTLKDSKKHFETWRKKISK